MTVSNRTLGGRGQNGASGNLALATIAFAVNFWAWNLISPLASSYSDQMSLSSAKNSVLVAMPVLVGSVGRIPVGALTDRYGGRTMFTLLSLITIAPSWRCRAGNAGSYPLLLLFGLFLGIAGTTFAVGIPFVNAWHEPSRRGFATGVFGAGMGGTALSAFFTPRFVSWFGDMTTHVIVAVALLATAGMARTMMRDAPAGHRTRPRCCRSWAGGEAPRHLVDVVPLRDHVRRLRGLRHLPADLPENGLPFSRPRQARAPPGSPSPPSSPARRWHPVGPDPPQAGGTGLAGRSGRDGDRHRHPAQPEVPAGLAFLAMAFSLGIGTGGVFAWVALRAPANGSAPSPAS